MVMGVWWAYDAVNNLNPLRAATALAHGATIVHLEAVLHMDPEGWLNRWLGAHLMVGRWIGDYYGIAHFAVTASVLVYVWWRHPHRYRMLRNALLGINLIGFLVFWAYPVAPPRMLSGLGFVDVAAVAHALGPGAGGALAWQANEYAAMPSLHVAWALWCAWALWAVRKDRLARVLAAGYAALTVIIAMATANHYFLDVVAGTLTASTAAGLAVLHGQRRSSRSAGPDPDPRRIRQPIKLGRDGRGVGRKTTVPGRGKQSGGRRVGHSVHHATTSHRH